MEQANANTGRILTWSGLIPFAALALVAVLGAPEWLQLMLKVYAALILSFMAGTLWARHLQGSKGQPQMLLVSNVLVLAAWPAVLMPPYGAALWLAVLFAAHLALESPWRADDMPDWYRSLRLAVSSSAIALLALGGLVGLGVNARA